MNLRSTILMLRIVAVVVGVAAVAAFVGELRSIPNLASGAIAAPLALLAIAGGVVALLLGLTQLNSQKSVSPVASTPDSMTQSRLIELSIKMEELAGSVDRLALARETPAVAEASPVSEARTTGASPDVLVALQRLFEELRDLSLLTDQQRQERAAEIKEHRKAGAIETANSLIAGQHWADANAALADLESQWPGDAAIETVRRQLQAQQAQAEVQALSTVESQIESAMSLSNWDEAAELARKLADDFPGSAQASKVLNRVEREKAIYTETTVGRLYDEIRHDVERRNWRRALAHAQKLLEKFPDHPRAEAVRKQIRTIQENAEIEERQEQEQRIGELIRSRRFTEAVQYSEELLRQFPTSPQAEAIQKMLPRIQQLAAESESKTFA